MSTTAALDGVSRITSPALRGFEVNLFRILRLPVSASMNEAAFQAESALTLARAGMSPGVSDPLPWLSPPGQVEIQQAAQTAEEPLERLKQQLLWFDCVRDPRASLLERAIRDPGDSAIEQYLSEEIELKETTVEAVTPDTGLVAHAINQANIRLLASAWNINHTKRTGSDLAFEVVNVPKEQWTCSAGFRVLPAAHEALLGKLNGAADFDPRAYWLGALQRWLKILNHSSFRPYLEALIMDLGDDFVSADDAEAVEESIRIYLADISAQEIRFLLLQGRYLLANSIMSAVAGAEFDTRVLMRAMRPVRQIFQSEISEIEPLLEHARSGQVETIGDYLNRLEVIRSRWLNMDGNSIVGLRELLDQAAEKSYFVIKNQDGPSKLIDSMLLKVANIASAQSLRERVATRRREIEEARTRLCHFCKTGLPDYEKSVVLHGRKETGREHNFNSTTVYYSIRYAIVLRCARCAKLHDYVRRVVLLLWLSLIPGAVLLFIWIVN